MRAGLIVAGLLPTTMIDHARPPLIWELVKLGTSVVLGACARSDERPLAVLDHPSVRMIAVAPDVRLEVDDWGGTGAPMVFLGGMGMEADQYRPFASRFRDAHHVYGINRRGSGASSAPANGYDAATRAHDIVVVLDSLHIDKAILVGHSFGGDELSKVGVAYASRVRALIYLEAYDYRRRRPSSMPPLPPQARNAWKSSADRSNRLATDSSGRATVRLNSDSMKLAGAEAADYSKIMMPALAIYADHATTAAQLFGADYERFDARNKTMARRYADADAELFKEVQDRFRADVRRGTVLIIRGADHLIYESNPDEVEHAMRVFMASP